MFRPLVIWHNRIQTRNAKALHVVLFRRNNDSVLRIRRLSSVAAESNAESVIKDAETRKMLKSLLKKKKGTTNDVSSFGTVPTSSTNVSEFSLATPAATTKPTAMPAVAQLSTPAPLAATIPIVKTPDEAVEHTTISKSKRKLFKEIPVDMKLLNHLDSIKLGYLPSRK